jgi:drug/metabolite transporter (DMT)-like permease
MISMGELAALVSAMTWSATSVALTSLSARTAPVVLSGLRLSIGGFFLLALLFASGHAGDVGAANGATILAMVGSGFVGYGFGDTMYIRALSMLGMQKTFPISMALYIGLTVVAGVALLGERFAWGLPAGAVFIAVGIYLIVIPARSQRDIPLPVLAASEPALAGFSDLPAAEHEAALRPAAVSHGWRGYALLGGAGLAWAMATLWLAAGKGDLPALAAASIRTPAGAIALVAFAMATQRPALAVPFRNRKHIGAIAATGIVGTAFGSLLYVYAVVTAGAARTAILSATSPLMALPLSIVFLGEKFTRRIGAGTLLCVAGIALVVA